MSSFCFSVNNRNFFDPFAALLCADQKFNDEKPAVFFCVGKQDQFFDKLTAEEIFYELTRREVEPAKAKKISIVAGGGSG